MLFNRPAILRWTAFYALLCMLVSPALAATLRRVAVIDLPGPPGKRFDYLTIDYEDHYLLSAHLAAGILYVIDMRDNHLVKAIPDVPGVEGVEYVPGLKKVYTSDSGDNQIGIVDLHAMRVIKTLPTAAKPDGSAFAEPFRKLYVSDERGKAEAIVDVDKDVIIRTLHFDSETGMPQYDPVARKIYVNLQDQNLLAVIDPASDRVVARYPVGRCRGNHGMALDPERHRAFLACEGNDLLAVFDLDAQRPIAFLPLPGGVDVIKFDPGLRRVYAACYSGAISIADDQIGLPDIEDLESQELRPRADGVEPKIVLQIHRDGGARENMEAQCRLYRQLYEAGRKLNGALDENKIVAEATRFVLYDANFQRCAVLLAAENGFRLTRRKTRRRTRGERLRAGNDLRSCRPAQVTACARPSSRHSATVVDSSHWLISMSRVLAHQR